MDQEYFDVAEGTVFSDPGWSTTRISFLPGGTLRVVNRQHISAEIGEVSL